ncbi:PAS domain-containing protein [Spirosoma linguale]|uniref:histidine kinase n=1 Tax=Spirosoma linguale (strain ATCC 33905 / DSM 74 / LMG 10896 / Claus 1) TaxID=504472 RepID=D2QUK8_SPILD|nr:PAS/PAC sensor signal transduction histidine kinase [Spirosoma linguale DSM 74]
MDANESPELLEAVLANSLTNIYAANAIRHPESGQIIDFQIVLANPTFRERSGYTGKQLRSQSLLTLYPDLAQSTLLGRFIEVVETRRVFRGEEYFPNSTSSFWYDLSLSPFGDGLVVNFTDTTARYQEQQLVQQQAQQLQATLDGSISSILAMTAIRNPQGQIIDFRIDKANQAVERSLGKTPAELEGHTLLSVYPGNVESGFFALYAKAADTGESQQATLHYTDVNGFQGWFEASAVRYAPDKIVLTFMNVTDYKQTEAVMRQQADLLQSVLDATMNTVATYQAVRDSMNQIVDFRFTMANQAALEVVNLTAEELYTRTLLEVSPDLANSELFNQYVTVVQTGLPITFERYRQGRWFLANAVRFGQDGLLTSSLDITLLKQAQLQVEQLNQQLQQRNASLDQFAAVASHDLQEPLRKIKSFGDILLDQYAPNLGDGVGLLSRMQSAADRMQTLIRSLLAYSRLSQEQPATFQPVDLNRVVTEVINDLEVAIQEKGAVLELSDLPTLPGDALQLRQVFQNLLSNALKFTKPGRLPRVILRAQPLRDNELAEEASLAPGSYWQITVADNGIGFGDEYRQQIFGAFERLHSKSSVYGGTGIGLAIVRKVMENHQGGVTAHSSEDEGATFTLFLPTEAS